MNRDDRNIEEDEIEIDLGALFRVLWKKAGYIIAAGILCGAIAFGASRMLLTPQYDSTTKFFVLSKNEDGQSTYSNVVMGSYMTQDYIELIKSRTVLERVSSRLGLDMSLNALSESITVSNPTDTHIMQITVRNPEPETAQKIADAVREEAGKHIKEVTDIDAVNTVDVANLPLHKASPLNGRNGVLGALLGVILTSCFFVIKYLLDDNIKNTEDVEKYLGLNVLAVLPVSEELNDGRNRKKKKSKKK